MSIRTLLSAVDLATEEIRDLIHAGTLKPGERINGEELAVELGISRTPIRDALQILRAEGLVEILPRVGAFVRQITPKEVEEVYALKASVEPLAVSWAATRGAAKGKQKLQEILKNLQSAASDGDIKLAADYVDEIHNEIFALADSEVLSEVYRVFHARVKLLRQLNMSQPGRLNVSVEQHTKIIQAVSDGDSENAAIIMADHLANAAASARKTVTEA